jgi:hypothetical protein
VNVLTEEQLPTETVLDNLFDADSASMPEFLAQLSNLAVPMTPELPVENAEAANFPQMPVDEGGYPVFPDISIEDAEVGILPEMSARNEEVAIPAEVPINEGGYPVFPDISVEDAEVGILPQVDIDRKAAPTNSSVTARPIASPDQITGEQADTIVSPAVPKAGRRLKASKAISTKKGQVGGDAIQEVQSEQGETQAKQAQE